ncbi:MAG: hypothetical protein SPL89_06255 [Clostridia bacterium]|nr:hypothetical protein [Clostridia bacterium]
MNIILKNSNGYWITIEPHSEAACLVELPDFGEISSDFSTYKIPGNLGGQLLSKTFSPRDITLKFEARRISESLINRTLSPLSEITGYIDGRYYFKGFMKSTAKRERQYEIMPPIYTVQIRMFDPCFYKLNNKRTVPFLNHGVNLYENGAYKYQKISLYNDGDIPCPVTVKMKALEKTAVAGLFTSADWNSGSPKYSGLRLKNPRETGTVYYASSNITDTKSLENYGYFQDYEQIMLAPGQNTLYAFNTEGTVEYEPKFLGIGGEA